MDKYRIFISYSHEDAELVEKLVKALEDMGLKPMWDRDFAFGLGFSEQIKTFISHAHVFLPLITELSSKRGWVHQEIGYAMALNVPVLPIAIGMPPGEMLQELHAVILSDDLSELRTQLTVDVFDNLIDCYQGQELALYECAELPEDRTAMMVKNANDILNIGEYGCVRQKGGLSSFNIPNRVLSDSVWQIRYRPSQSAKYHKQLQREERLALERHAQHDGCQIIVNPNAYSEYDLEARMVRLKTLLEFLQTVPEGKVQVAFNERMGEEENITIVGDWFAAESISMASFRQTVFTRHAASMKSRIEYFDQEFDELLQQCGWEAETSRILAINEIQKIVDDLENANR